jgi:hypothetical protein
MKILLYTMFLALLSFGSAARAEPVVVVSAASAIGQLSHDEVVNIFLGRYRSLPSGGLAIPIDQPENAVIRAEFYRRLVNKNINEINAYWARLVFSGKTAPPRQVDSATGFFQLLMASPDAIGYVDRSQVDRRLRVVLEFPQ